MNSSNSSISSEDEDEITPHHSEFLQTLIPRTHFHSFERDETDDHEEEYHEAFPLSNFVSNFFPDFKQRKNSDPDPFLILPPFFDESSHIPPPANTKIEGIFVHLLDFAILSDITNKKSYIHSWYDLASGTSVEAKRIITSFFTKKYEKIHVLVKDKKDLQLPQFSWATNINTKLFSKPNQSLKHLIRIFHYVGLGFPPPKLKEIFLKDNIYSKCNYMPLRSIIKSLQPPSMLIFDCDKAAILRNELLEIQKPKNGFDTNAIQIFFAFFACSESEELRIPSNLPQDFFSCILLTPKKAYSKVTGIEIEDKRQFLLFLDIFTESIALDLLQTDQFHLLFRLNYTTNTLWRRFLLAQRLMKRLGLHCQSIPSIVDTSEHQLWAQFDYAMRCVGKCNFDTLSMFSNLYQNNFKEVKQPPQFACAFVSSLLKIPQLKSSILALLAKFMQRSPLNCRLIRKMVDYDLLGNIDSVIRTPLLKHWCIVMSGSLLIDDSLSKSFVSSFSQTQEMIKISLDPNYPEKTRVFLLSLLSCMKDSPNHMNNSEEKTKAFLTALFRTSPHIRQWISIFLHSAMARYAAEPRLNGPTGIHAHMTFLMYDDLSMTRAFAITILTTIMAPHCPDFNENVMHCALKGAVDGSSDVRIAFLYCVARYVNLNNEQCDEDDSEKIDNILRSDPIAFSNSIDKPKLRAILEMLENDPLEEIRKISNAILKDPVNSGLEVRYQEFATTLHEKAHANLFIKDYIKIDMKIRYYDTLFNSNNLELFETIKFDPKNDSNAKINCVSFNQNNRTLCYATEGGDIVFGNNHWIAPYPILNICHFCDNIIVASSIDGAIHVFRGGFESEIDSFLPSILHYSEKIEMVSDGNQMLYIAQDSNEIMIWNLLSLLLINRIQTELQIQKLAYANGYIYAALINGRIIQINENTLEIEKVSDRFLNQVILNMGCYINSLWTVNSAGEVYLWRNFDDPSCIYKFNGNIKFITIAQSFPLILSIQETVNLTNFESGATYELKFTKTNGVCCCIDNTKPLAAIGYDDGTLAIWRLPL